MYKLIHIQETFLETVGKIGICDEKKVFSRIYHPYQSVILDSYKPEKSYNEKHPRFTGNVFSKQQ